MVALQVKHRCLEIEDVARSQQCVHKRCPHGTNTTLRSRVKQTVHRLLIFWVANLLSDVIMLSLFTINALLRTDKFSNCLSKVFALSKILLISVR